VVDGDPGNPQDALTIAQQGQAIALVLGYAMVDQEVFQFAA
jgi:hypothetical protein